MYPTQRGFRTLPSPMEFYPALKDATPTNSARVCKGAYYARYLDGGVKFLAGGNDKLFRADAGAWVDASGLQTFNVSTEDRWRFAQFGNNTIAVNGNDGPQSITNAGSNFAIIATAPVAKYVATANNFVFLANLSGGSLTETSWWTSAIGDLTDWDADIATQSVNGALNDTEGPITAVRALGRNVVVYKERSVYLFEYVGPPIVWANQILSQRSGALSDEAVVDIGGTHVFMGYDDFYIFDGSGPPRKAESPLREFIFEEDALYALDRNYGYAVAARYDRIKDVVFFHYPSVALAQNQTSPPTLDRFIAWTPGTNRWAQGGYDVTQVILPEIGSSLGLTYIGFGSEYTNWEDATGVSWQSQIFAGASGVIQGVVQQDDEKFYVFTGGVHADSYVRTGLLGNGVEYAFIREARPRFARAPVSATGTRCVVNVREFMAAQPVESYDQIYDPSVGSFQLRGDRRYADLKIEFGEHAEILGLDIDVQEGTGAR